MLLSNCLINKVISLNAFLSLRCKDSSYGEVSGIGFNKEVASKSLIKMIDRFFK